MSRPSTDGKIISRCGHGADPHRFGSRAFGALHDARLLPELAADLLDHAESGSADGLHRQRAEDERRHGAEEGADQDLGFIRWIE